MLIMFVNSSLRSILAELRLQVCYLNKRFVLNFIVFHSHDPHKVVIAARADVVVAKQE